MCCDVFCLPLMCSLILFNFQLICVIGFYLIAWTLSICFQLLHKLCTIMTTVNYTDVQFGCKHFVDLILSTQQLTTDWFCLLITNYFVRWSYGIFNSYNVVIVSVFFFWLYSFHYLPIYFWSVAKTGWFIFMFNQFLFTTELLTVMFGVFSYVVFKLFILCLSEFAKLIMRIL